MATTTMTTFKPSTDHFGELTMHATFLGEQALGQTSGVRKDRINLLIALAFLITLIIGAVTLFRMDQALFSHDAHQVAMRVLPVDYD